MSMRRSGVCQYDQNMTRADIRDSILSLLDERGSGKTICPSEAVRHLTDDETEWRVAMPTCRDVAGELVEAGEIEICQKGEVVSLSEAKGPIRLRKVKTT